MNSLNPTLVNDDALTYNLEDSTPKMVETVDIDEPKAASPSDRPWTWGTPQLSRLIVALYFPSFIIIASWATSTEVNINSINFVLILISILNLF